MIYVHWIVFVAYVAVVAATVVKVLLDNRQPEKTMAWVMVLVLVPVAGFVLYFFFGQDTRRMRLISQRSMDQLTRRTMYEFTEQRDLKVSDQHKPLVKLFANQSMALPFKDNEADIFTCGDDFFTALLQEIWNAGKHIHLDTYIIEDDPLGRLVADMLCDKARQGVEVRLIYDDVGCWKVRNRFFERMREAGVDVHAFMPVKFPAFTGKVNYRNHRKLCVIDGQVAFIGGMNIALRYVRGNKGRPWRDTHLRVRGGAVYAIQRAFLIDWYFVDRTLITDRKYYPPQNRPVCNNCIAQVVTSSPVAPWPDIMQGYVRILIEAKDYVYIETPYFLPTEPILFALRTAALAGVDVRLMLPRHSDSRLMEWASISYVQAILEAGVRVFLYQDGFNHSKLMVCDDTVCTCGSTNVDFRSFENNFEANIFFYDQAMAQRFKEVFRKDMAMCTEISERDGISGRPFFQRLWESLVRLLSPLL
ncbi:MAG: cardiolipin synthase [Prevotella sp.]